MISVGEVIAALGLAPHPEGGYFREIYRDAGSAGSRGSVTSIYYLLEEGQVSAWHRVDATEIWHYHAGAALILSVSADGRRTEMLRLGAELAAGERPQAVVPPGAWQSARSEGKWTLVGCTVAPAFEFAGFELAPAGWAPG